MAPVGPLILVLSNGSDVTADFFESRLQEREIEYLRLNTEDFSKYQLSYAVKDGAFTDQIQARSPTFSLEGVAAVYYRRPRPADLPGIEDPGLRLWIQNEFRQAWGGVLMSKPKLRWVNHPIAIGGASFKPEQLARAAQHGLHVPDSLLTTDPAAARQFCEAHSWNVVTKPVGHGEIRGADPMEDRLVYTNRVDESLEDALDEVVNCPTLFQVMIAKRYDIRATIVGAECVAVALHSQERAVSRIDCRRDNMSDMRYSLVDLPEQLVARLLELTRSYGLHFAAIDLILDRDGEYWYLELNPAGQWAWLEMIAGAPISDGLIRCLTSQ